MAKQVLIKTVRVRGDLVPRVQGGLDRKLLIYKEGNDIILLLTDLNNNPVLPRIRYSNTPLSSIDTVVIKYLTGPQNLKIIQDPFDPNVIPFQDIPPDPPTPPVESAPTPQQIEQTRQEEAATRQQAQENTQLQQVDPAIVEQSTPEELKPKGKAKLGQRILNLGKKILQIILPKLRSMFQQYAIAQFEEARVQATTPEQIDQVKQQFCPAPAELANLILTRDNIVNQLNGIGNQLSGLNFSIGATQDVTRALTQLSTIVESVKIGLSAASKTIPLIPGSVPAVLSDLETLDDKVIPLLEKNQGALNATPVPIAIVTSTINKVVRTLGQLDILISFCAPNSQVVPISDTIRTLSEIQTRSDINSGNYKGFILQIEEVPYTATVTRRKAVALNTSGIKLLETPLSFTTNNQTLIDELKLIIDRDNLKAY